MAANASADASWTRRVEAVVLSLQVRLGVDFDSVLVRSEVEAEFATYDAARVREFVPILVESHVRTRLRRQIPTVRFSPLPANKTL